MANNIKDHNGNIVYTTPVTEAQAKGGIVLYLILFASLAICLIFGFDAGILIYIFGGAWIVAFIYAIYTVFRK